MPVEYRCSCNELTRFLNQESTKKVLSNDCRTAIVELQMNLRTKESKLAGYRRKGLKGTMEARNELFTQTQIFQS